jgi:glycine cleavage system regulatory protein
VAKAEPADPAGARPMNEADKAIVTSLGGKVATKKVPQDQGQTQQAQPQTARKIIRSGEMEFEVESFDSSVVKIDTIAGEEQGVIATVNSEKLPNGKVRGTIVVRVPPDHLATLVIKLRALGDLKSQKLGSEDVTKSYFDLESRLRAARAMEERLLRIIKEGKGEIKDLLLAEKELGEWRTKIEQYEGEKRYYDNLISLSTLTVTLFEKEIRAAFGITETERIDAGVEVEDVEKAYKDLLEAVAQAKGRITKSDLKKLAAGQFSATVNFEVAPDAAGGLRDRLKQLGNVARLDVNIAQQTEGGRSPTPDIKVKRNDSQFFVSLYNLANVDPRLTVHLNLACFDAEKAYKAVLERVEKAGGRVRTSNLDRQKSDQTSGRVDFQVKESEAETVLLDVRALGETMTYQVTESSDVANVTRSKRGFMIQIFALGMVQPREAVTIQLVAKDVAAAYQALSDAVRKAEGRILIGNLNENDRRNITATLSFDVRRDAMKGVDEAMKTAGEIYSRTSNRSQDAQNVVDSKVKFDLTLLPVGNIRPREAVTLALEVNKVDAAVEMIQKIVADTKGVVKDSQHNRGADGRQVSRMIIDVPYRDRRAAAARMKELGTVRVEEARPNPAVPDSELAVAQFDVTLSNEVLVPSDSAPWASIKKGFSVSVLALSWSLTFIMIGLCLVVPIALIGWGGWKLVKRAKKQPTPTA